MNMHHITKSLFVGAAIAGIGMSSGKAEITFSQEFRTGIRNVVRKVLTERCGALNALYPNTISDVQLGEDIDKVCNALFDHDSGFAHFFTDGFHRTHPSIVDYEQIYAHPDFFLRCWFERNILHQRSNSGVLPDDVQFQGDTALNIDNAVALLVKKIAGKQDELTALQKAGLIADRIDDNPKHYSVLWSCAQLDPMCFDIAYLWYPYILAHFNESRKAHYEVCRCLDFRHLENAFCRAFLVSLVRNYSRYLTIKEDLQNNRFTSDTYWMYVRFKEANESLKQMVLYEKFSGKGTEGSGILSFFGTRTVDFFAYETPPYSEAEIWARMSEKLKEMDSFAGLVEPKVKKICHRYREFMRILADTDNR